MMNTKVYIIIAAVAFFAVIGIGYAIRYHGGEVTAVSFAGNGKRVGKETAGSSAENDGDDGENTPGMLVVHVAGEVMNPGIYELPDSSRVVDAVEMAGGFTGEADEASVNLAAFIRDAQKITVRNVSERQATYGPAGLDGMTVNINTAGTEELKLLPNVGDSTAANIIRYREEYGGFLTVEDIMNVTGIGERKFESMKEYITVE